MRLEEKIQQKGFSNGIQKAMVNISYTNSYLSGILNATLKTHNISLPQYNVLRILAGQHPKPISVNEITARMVDKMSNASRLVDKLCTKEVVERTTCEYDKRQVDINITEKGKELLKVLTPLVDQVVQNHNNLSAEESETLNTLLDKLRGEN